MSANGLCENGTIYVSECMLHSRLVSHVTIDTDVGVTRSEYYSPLKVEPKHRIWSLNNAVNKSV